MKAIKEKAGKFLKERFDDAMWALILFLGITIGTSCVWIICLLDFDSISEYAILGVAADLALFAYAMSFAAFMGIRVKKKDLGKRRVSQE